jgi:diacylglycerol kinase family enzyme
MRIPYVPLPVTDVPPPAEVVEEAKPTPEAFDVVMRVLSTAANHGKLWFGFALAGAVAGRSTRRAAIRGVGSLALASFTANSLIKPLVGRRRPDLERTHLARRIGTRPWTSSFPSGHSASAAAFATGVGLELPVAALAIAPVAAGVAYSRVHVGVHYKSDVVVGCLIGVGAALAIKKLWPTRYHGPARSLRADVPALPEGEGLTVVVNRASGSSADAGEEIAKLLPKARIVQWDPDDGPKVLHGVVDVSTKALGVAGGDGTCASVAGIALERGLPLAVFPAGTLNHFAKALGLEAHSDTAQAVTEGVGGAVDVARLNGVPFLNTASVGVYPDFVAVRDKLAPKWGKFLAAAIAMPRVFAKGTPTTLTINGRTDRVWTVFVGNGHYTPRGLVSSTRDHMADGLVDVQIIYDRGRWSRARATIFSLVDQVQHSGVYGSLHTTKLEISMETESLRVAHDGEVELPRREAVIDLADRHLRVYRRWELRATDGTGKPQRIDKKTVPPPPRLTEK